MLRKVFIVSVFASLIPMMPIILKGKEKDKEKTIYEYKVETIDGDTFDMSTLKGKKVMIVNVASKCGFTYQYEKLQALYSEYKDKDFVIIGFPANNFGSQEPGTNETIKSFCSLTYGVEFPMMAKISVVGDDMAPIYKWLTLKELNGVSDNEVNWNFNKFLINEDGTMNKRIGPRVEPDDKEIIEWIISK